MKKFMNILWYILIGGLLFIVSLVNIEKIVHLDLPNIYTVLLFLYILVAISIIILSRMMRKPFSREILYIMRFILLFSSLLLPWIFINHNFLVEHLWESNLYLRAYGKVAMWYFAMALVVSPVLQYVKKTIWREYIIFSRKILWILSFIFFLKHWLEYFSLEYIYHEQYYMETPYLDYVLENLLVRYDALSWSVAWILMLVLWLTSNKFSVRFLWKKWKILQLLVFPAFLISAVHIAFASRFEWFYVFLISFVVIMRLAWYLNRKQRRSSWKIIWYRCTPCGYIYNEKIGDLDSGIIPGTKFEDIPDTWSCPVCGVTKDDFEPIYEWEEIHLDSKIIWYTMLTKDVLELKIEVRGWENIQVKPGQFANIYYKDENWWFFRSYSVVEITENILIFCIKLKPNWRWSSILRKLNIWDALIFTWIFGKFTLQDTDNPRVFIATWTGISPIMSMIRNTGGRKNYLFFGVSYKKDLFYVDQIQKIKNLNSEIFLSREEDFEYRYWRIDLSTFNFSKDTEFYICGSSSMVESNVEFLEEKWYKDIYFERF